MTASQLMVAERLSRHFDVSPSWLTRKLAGTPRRILKAVDDVSFAIPKGATLALVGESGCGKSTAARCIAGLLAPSSGAARYRDTDMREVAKGRAGLRREVQMIFQDPYGSLNPRLRVGRTIADPLVALGIAGSRAERRERVGQLLREVGLSPADAEKFPHEFSGGQRQRIAIARALASKPAFVICDEPTSALDVSIQAQILNLMRDLQDEHGLTYLFISHNLAVVDHMADRVAVMYLGRIVENTTREQLFSAPAHPYTRQLIAASPSAGAIGKRHEPMRGEVPNPANPPAGCSFHPRCPAATNICRSERPELRSLGDAREAACHHAEALA
ncbi:ABC transporter ATP-binding protein [Bosea sp. PAMC 26642]|uniref:ABC transporter ATP-binding protein n=1 Tax=Bosea sp. (strain PAMC 26642) TaxID=1792307 RepID=UPI00076FF9EA|nr:oligopeptide/dipeptide ABC transporter ATP-binding protein [Bosea sp. PAMC 26642]AMJ61103.1 ABC transporter ATP-binding protein [Bosea sp. PAMC 26642]